MKIFKNKASTKQPEKRDVLQRNSVAMWHSLDDAFRETLKAANLEGDADEVIACLQDSPRFRKLVQDEAERKIKKRMEELEAAVEAFKNAASAP